MRARPTRPSTGHTAMSKRLLESSLYNFVEFDWNVVTEGRSRNEDSWVPFAVCRYSRRATKAIDWGQQQAEILRHFGRLIHSIPNPPGNETKAVEYLKKFWRTKASPLRPSHSIPIARIWWRA